MWISATVNAYDVMGLVYVTAVTRGTGTALDRSEDLVLTASTTLDGVGETNLREWLVDALVGLLESL